MTAKGILTAVGVIAGTTAMVAAVGVAEAMPTSGTPTSIAQGSGTVEGEPIESVDQQLSGVWKFVIDPGNRIFRGTDLSVTVGSFRPVGQCQAYAAQVSDGSDDSETRGAAYFFPRQGKFVVTLAESNPSQSVYLGFPEPSIGGSDVVRTFTISAKKPATGAVEAAALPAAQKAQARKYSFAEGFLAKSLNFRSPTWAYDSACSLGGVLGQYPAEQREVGVKKGSR